MIQELYDEINLLEEEKSELNKKALEISNLIRINNAKIYEKNNKIIEIIKEIGNNNILVWENGFPVMITLSPKGDYLFRNKGMKDEDVPLKLMLGKMDETTKK